MSVEILVAAAVVPAAALLFLVYRMDTVEKEPWSLLGKLLLFGAISCIPAFVVEMVLDNAVGNILWAGSLPYYFARGFIVAALVEESLKFLFLYLFTFKNKAFNYRFDGIVYAVFVSMGFAILENVLYVLGNGLIEGEFSDGLRLAIIRALLALPLHATCGVYMGISYGQQKIRSLQRRTSFVRIALACLPMAILIHGLYDALAFSAGDYPICGMFFLLFVIAVFIVTVFRLKRASREDRPLEDKPAEEVIIDA